MESFVALLVLLLVRYAAARLIIRRYRNANFDITRKELTIKLINVLFFVLAKVFDNLDQSDAIGWMIMATKSETGS